MYSSSNPPCNKTYFNYASYMSTRNCEQQICKIVSDIENGNILPHFLTHGGVIGGPVTLTDSVTITGSLHVDGTLTFSGETFFANLKSKTFELHSDEQRLTINTDGASSPTVSVAIGTINDPTVDGSDVTGTINYTQWDLNAILEVQLSGIYTSVPLVFLTGSGQGVLITHQATINTAGTVNFQLMSNASITSGSIQYLVVDRG